MWDFTSPSILGADIRKFKKENGMGEKTITMQVAEYAAADHWEQLKERDIRMTKLAYVDWIAAAMTGVTEESVRILMELSEEEGIRGDCVILGQGKKTSPLNAALINATESHAIDFDDIHDFLSLHLCSPVIPAALAAAEYKLTCGADLPERPALTCGADLPEKPGWGALGHKKADGKALINGTINGMQVMVALSAAVMPEHYNLAGWHATGTLGVFGAAAAAGAILGITPDQMCNAFGICAGLCSGVQLNFGTMTKPMTAGMAAKNGLMAAILASRGFTGRADIFDTDFLDHISAKQADKETIAKRLYGPLGVHELRFKRYPCGAPTHSGIINCKKILEEHPAKVSDIEKIVFEPYPRAIRLAGVTHPATGLQGKFSIPFTAAAQIVFGQVTIETFNDMAVKNPQIQYLLDRMEMVANDEFTPSRGGKTTIYFKDGTSYSHSTYLLGHDLDLNEAEAEMTGKYAEIMNPRVGEDAADKIYLEIGRLEDMKDIRELTALL